MSNGTILGPRGQSWVELGGERTWKQYIKGDLVITFQWLETGDREPSPCMVLFPSGLKLNGGAYAIPQANAHLYATSRGNPTEHLFTAAMKAVVQMGWLHTDKAAWTNVVTAILEGLPDLIKMPSEQPGSFDLKRAILGIEATTKVAGKVIHQEVV